MIPPLGGGGREFESRNGPCFFILSRHGLLCHGLLCTLSTSIFCSSHTDNHIHCSNCMGLPGVSRCSCSFQQQCRLSIHVTPKMRMSDFQSRRVHPEHPTFHPHVRASTASYVRTASYCLTSCRVTRRTAHIPEPLMKCTTSHCTGFADVFPPSLFLSFC